MSGENFLPPKRGPNMKDAVNLLSTGLAGRHDLVCRACTGSDLRSKLPGLPSDLRRYGALLLRMRLHFDGPVRGVGVGPIRPVRGQSILCQARSAQKAVPQVTASFTPGRRITPEPVIGPRFARTRWAPIRPAGLKPRANQQQIRCARHH